MNESDRRQDEIAKMEASIRNLAKKRAPLDSESEEEPDVKKEHGPSLLQAEMAKYKTRTVERDKEGKKRRKDESDILAKLNSFKDSLLQPDQDEEMEDEGNEEGE